MISAQPLIDELERLMDIVCDEDREIIQKVLTEYGDKVMESYAANIRTAQDKPLRGVAKNVCYLDDATYCPPQK